MPLLRLVPKRERNVGERMKRSVKQKKASSPTTPALTPRQQQILKLVVDGYTSREIAEQLKISLQTVEVHRFNLMRRLDVRNVAQLIRQALVLRYLPMASMQKALPSLKA